MMHVPQLDTIRTIANDIAAPLAEHTDQAAIWPEHTIRAIQQAGLGSLVIPKEYGGEGCDLLIMAQACEILGQACSSSALCIGMHWVASAVIAAKATPFQQQTLLKPIIAGQHITTIALSEPGSGSHFYLPQTKMVLTDSETMAVSGEKTFVTNGAHADSYVLSCVSTNATKPVGEFSCFILPHSTDGVVWGKPWQGFGMRGNSACSLQLDSVKLPSAMLLGETGDEIWYVFTVIAPYFLMAMAGTYLGVAQAALNQLHQHITQRRYSHAGTYLAENPIIQHRYGELWAKVERSRQLVYAAPKQEDNIIPYLASAKAEVAECAVEVINEAMTLMGGIAYRDSSIMSRLMRDARAVHVMAPTTDILRLWTGRALLGMPLLVD